MHQQINRVAPLRSLAEGNGHSVAKAASRPANPCLCDLGFGTRIVVGNAGDHSRVLAFLTQHYQVPLAEDFQSRLDDPAYEPTDRMLLVRAGQLIGQLQLSRQSAWFEGERIPTAAIRDCAILPEMHPPELMTPLLATAESTALAEGAILAVARPDQPELFAANGWSTCRAQGHTQANTRALLAHITAQLATRKHRHPHVEIRTWWHFELEAIQPVYEQVATAMWGTLHRSDDAWRWLVGRKAHDQILIAVRHKHEETTESEKLHVVGYAVVRDSCIVEMMTLPGYAAVRLMLVARACRDAIDRDHHFVSLHTPATDPMHELLVTAGGSWHAYGAQQGSPWMHKLLSPEKWVERLYPQLYHRAKEAGIPRPLEIGFEVDERRYRFLFTRRSVRLEHALPSSHTDVACDALTFQELLTSNLAWTTARERGLLRVEDPGKAAILAALFPPRLFWQSPFELLRL